MDGTVTIYADVLFFINFVIDYLCLYITGKILCARFKLPRMAAAAALGGGYSCLAVYLDITLWYIALPMHIASALLICAVAFGRKAIWPKTGMFILTCGLLGGIMCGAYALMGRSFYIGGGFYMDADPLFVLVFGITASAAALLYLLFCRKKSYGKYADITFTYNGAPFHVRLLCDSGCFLRDSISGDPVIIVAKKALGWKINITGADEETLGALGKTSRLIPVHTVSGSNILPAFRPESINLHCDSGVKTLSAVIAIDYSDTPYGGFDGIIPTEVLP